MTAANSQAAVAEKHASSAEKLLRDQIGIFDQMSDRFENATTESKRKREMPAIKALGELAGKLNQEFLACPVEEQQAARAGSQ